MSTWDSAGAEQRPPNNAGEPQNKRPGHTKGTLRCDRPPLGELPMPFIADGCCGHQGPLDSERMPAIPRQTLKAAAQKVKVAKNAVYFAAKPRVGELGPHESGTDTPLGHVPNSSRERSRFWNPTHAR